MNKIIDSIRSVNNFPKKGIVFRDITTLLKDAEALKQSLTILHDKYASSKIDKIVGIESRGFILGSALAISLGIGFVPIRKKGKLPAEVISEEYKLEYGVDTIEMHKDALRPGERVIIHDDLLATGGTMLAAAHLVNQLNADVVGLAFLIELSFLKGRDRLKYYDVFSIVQYENE